jgi:dienelactone hydrolase
MRDTKVDWQLCVYGGAVHSFTNPDADKLGNPAFAYNAAADRRSWAAMLSLFEEVFGAR